MAAPPHLVSPDPSHQPPSLPSPVLSPDSWPASSSLSSSDSSFSSFSLSFFRHGDPLPSILKQEEEKQQQRQRNDVLEKPLRQKNRAKIKQITKSSSAEPLRECKIASSSCTKRVVSVRKACCRNVGVFAGDCAAVSCCPCAVFSFLSLVLIDLPSSLARRMVSRLQRRLCKKDAMSMRSGRGGESSHSIFTPIRLYREASEGEPAASIIRFSTQSLLEHFEAENVGFGCLSREREQTVSYGSSR